MARNYVILPEHQYLAACETFAPWMAWKWRLERFAERDLWQRMNGK